MDKRPLRCSMGWHKYTLVGRNKEYTENYGLHDGDWHVGAENFTRNEKRPALYKCSLYGKEKTVIMVIQLNVFIPEQGAFAWQQYSFIVQNPWGCFFGKRSEKGFVKNYIRGCCRLNFGDNNTFYL